MELHPCGLFVDSRGLYAPRFVLCRASSEKEAIAIIFASRYRVYQVVGFSVFLLSYLPVFEQTQEIYAHELSV